MENFITTLLLIIIVPMLFINAQSMNSIKDTSPKRRRIIRSRLAVLYLISAYLYIINFFALDIRYAVKPVGWVLSVAQTILSVLVFVIINHFFVKRVFSNRLIVIIEVLLVLTILTILWSDLKYEQWIYGY